MPESWKSILLQLWQAGTNPIIVLRGLQSSSREVLEEGTMAGEVICSQLQSL